MFQVRIKVVAGMGDPTGTWEIIDFDEFLVRHCPQLSLYVSICKQFPPFHVLNEELMSGGRDLGMSGGCFWKPFELSSEDYELIKEDMLTNPKLNITYDSELEACKNLKKWCGTVTNKYNPRRLDK